VSTVAFLTARAEAHEMAFAKLRFPEVKKLIDTGINHEQYNY